MDKENIYDKNYRLDLIEGIKYYVREGSSLFFEDEVELEKWARYVIDKQLKINYKKD